MLSVGEILKKERENKNIQLVNIEKAIKVRAKFLKAVEENNWESFSSKIYITGIIKNYSQFLGLDEKKILAFFRRDYEKAEDVRFKTRVPSQYLTPETKKVAITILVIIFVIFFGYFAYQLKLFLSPPGLTFISPKTDRFTTENKVHIEGKTDRDAMISIFGERVYQNREGIFEYDFPLKNGKNELVIEIVGANGKKAMIKKTYIKTSPL